MDFGFWQKADRREADEFYRQHGITPRWHYVDTPNDVWQKGIAKRNEAILRGETLDYYVDEGLAKKFDSLFEPPERHEIDVWYTNAW